NTPGGETILVGGLLWFVISMLLVHLIWYLARKQFEKYSKKKKPAA
ncbi:MAG: hypothetical protein JRE58_06690, partial [Deltaproteobacteria bacterium]|nr:hypothetical protein [Deltaproteobacteria bacterium]